MDILYIIYILYMGRQGSKDYFHVYIVKEEVTTYAILTANTSLSSFPRYYIKFR